MHRHTAFSCVLFWILVVCLPIAADNPLPDLESGRMSLTWNDFKVLLEKFTSVKPPEAAPVENAPVESAMSRARYDAAVVSPNSVRIAATFGLTVFKPQGWVSVPVLGNTSAPVSALLDGQDTTLVRNTNNGFSALLNAPGTHTLELVFFASATVDKGVASFSFASALTPLTQMTLNVPAPDVVVESPQAVNIVTSKADDHVTAELAFRSSDTIEVRWSSPAIVQQSAAPQEAPRVTCAVSTLAAITDRYLACESLLRFEVLRGGTDTFHFRLPYDVNVLNVTGEGSAWNSAKDGASNIIDVKVNRRIEDNYAVSVTYEVPLDPAAPAAKLRSLEALDVVRTSGYVGVSARANVEVTSNPDCENLVRIDASELPVSVRSLSPNPILLAFKYSDNAYVLAMDIRRLEDVAVRVASIDHASLLTVITNEGAAVTRARYDVRNNVKQFLRVELPKDAELWSAEVAGSLVKPARDAATGAVLIPLSKSVEANKALGAFPVELTYMQTVARPPSFWGTLDLRTAPADILVNELEWEIRTPETERVCWASGDLLPLDRAPVQRQAGASRITGPTRVETIARLQDGVPKAAAAPAAPAASATPAAIAVAGIMPISTEIPIEGIAHAFRRVIVREAQPLSLRLYFYHGRLARTASAFFTLLSLLTGAALTHTGRRLYRKHPVSRTRLACMGAGAAFCLTLPFILPVSLKPLFLGLVLTFGAEYLSPRLRARIAASMPDAAEKE